MGTIPPWIGQLISELVLGWRLPALLLFVSALFLGLPDPAIEFLHLAAVRGEQGWIGGIGALAGVSGLVITLGPIIVARAARVREAKIEEQLEVAAQEKAISEALEGLSADELDILQRCHKSQTRTFRAPTIYMPALALNSRGLLTVVGGPGDPDDRAFVIPEAVWRYINQHPERIGYRGPK